jgi:O-acetyl-ADP-ribose deacetylase (regulator of RNase III)
MLYREEGDLFATTHQAYAHGVNAKGVMDAGIAQGFKRRYPEMFAEYAKRCEQGTLKPGDVYFYYPSPARPAIFNLVTQSGLSNARPEALYASIGRMHRLAQEYDIKDIAMPLIGCGQGGLFKEDLLVALDIFTYDPHRHVTVYSPKRIPQKVVLKAQRKDIIPPPPSPD